MKLTEIDLKGYGAFLDEKAGFEIQEFFTPEPWDYIYTNRKILMRIRHNGTGYVQLDPPGGTVLHKMERFQDYPSFFVWLRPEGDKAFSNFFKPHFHVTEPDVEPEDFSCIFTPGKASYRLKWSGLEVTSEMTVAPEDPAVIARFTIRNTGGKRRVDVIPVWRPHNTSSALDPWDVPENYQTAEYVNDPHQVIWVETRNPSGVARLRRRAFIMTDMEADTAEVYYDRFVGEGGFELPQAVLDGALGIDGSKAFRYLSRGFEHTAICVLPVAAFHKKVVLEKDGTYTFAVVLAGLSEQPDGAMPPYEDIARYSRFLEPGAVDEAAGELTAGYESYADLRSIDTPDEAFNRYVNEWIPLQLRWVTMLDRGWPTGLRGTRDAAQDFTGLIPLRPEEARSALLDIFRCQRTDGWFPRQFSTDGPEGRHDLRPYVDAGCWVWEFLFDYIRFTGDFAVLEQRLRWLDSAEKSDLAEHARMLLSYYVAEENLGEHGLVKIRGGDWNDSINAAGLEGRGESVMVSCQVVLALRQAAELFSHVGLDDGRWDELADGIRENLRNHALNDLGYLNGVFTDNGQWVFSPHDPDGRRRINSPVNAFGIIAGIFEPDELPTVIEHLKGLKQDNGYALFLPGIGDPPIEKLGRLGQGDLLPGVGENGNPYNHGSHGFLGRALAAAGRGDLLRDVLKYMLPYDQDAHPVEIAKTAPYAIVNHWMSIEGQFGKGGSTFLSGSITTALRNVYGGMLGFEPQLKGIRISPAVPSSWRSIRYVHNFRGGTFDVTIENPDGVEHGVKGMILNGKRIEGDFIPLDLVDTGGRNVLEVTLGR